MQDSRTDQQVIGVQPSGVCFVPRVTPTPSTMPGTKQTLTEPLERLWQVVSFNPLGEEPGMKEIPRTNTLNSTEPKFLSKHPY